MLFHNTIIFLLAVGVCLGIYGCYFGAVALAGFCKKTKAHSPALPQKRFALVVAARNEEAVIGPLVDSLLQQNYPGHLFDVIVAPNNCTDNTATVAAEHGAVLFCPQGPIRSKGEVLEQVVQQVVLRKGYDAVCVFDADNLVDADFLSYMNTCLCNGAQVVQGFRDSKNYSQSTMSGCYSICYWMLNHFYNKGREVLGLSALINGSGFAVSSELLARLGGWHTVTMTEDYEFSAQCVLAGQRVHFCAEARVYDEQPLTFAQSWKQRRRWTTGSVQGLQRYGGALFAQALKKRCGRCLDMCLTFLSPAVQLVGLAMFVLNGAVMLLGGGVTLNGVMMRGATMFMVAIAGSVAFMLVGSAVAAGVTALLQKVPLSKLAKSIASYGVFLFTFSVLTVLGFCNKKTTWEPIAHTSVKTIAEMQRE